MRWIFALSLWLLAGCSTDPNGAAGIAWNTFWDELRGAPDAEALAATATFEEAGIAFEHPSALRRRESVDEDGDRSWSLESGLFELELYAPRRELAAADYLDVLASVMGSGGTMHAEATDQGRSELFCGRRVTATRLRVRVMGDWSEYQAFDLPAPAGESRLLIFDDEPVDGQPSTVAEATWRQVFDSLRCDPDFVFPEADVAVDHNLKRK